MSQINQLNPELKNKIYYIEKDQIDLLERKIDKSMTKLKELFNKEELIKFLFKCIDSDKYDFSQGAPGQENPFTEEKISKKKDEFCREIKEILDIIDPQIFHKYYKRILKAIIIIVKEIKRKKEMINNPIRKVKIERIHDDTNENKEKYDKLNEIKDLIKETIYISTFYNTELVNINELFIQKLNEFYNDKSNIEIINYINGEEKRAKGDELIQKVVKTKENAGKQFIINTKNYIHEIINEQMNLNNEIIKNMEELNSIKKQQESFDEYCNDKNNIFKEINEVDFYM
jgi:hypothetical protein